mmetsp:Transcript_8203/g.16163  ORF Transcript_8203/g.16163 Transcript_8203/m.16163 type:complete len:266 (+) Transcript_8203:13093-13890(+)
MVDWPGLLKWTLKHSDGTGSSQAKPLDEETRKWLSEAFEHYTIDEGKLLREASNVISAQEQGNDQEELDKKLEAMDRIEDVIENMEASRTLARIGGLEPIVKAMLGSSYSELRLRCTKVFSSCVQNNPKVQKTALDLESMDGLIFASRLEESIELREAYVTALSALVRGEFEETRLAFIEKEGLRLISELLSSPPSLRTHKKVLLLLTDLLYHESVKTQGSFAADYTRLGITALLQQPHTDPDVIELSRGCLNAAGEGERTLDIA